MYVGVYTRKNAEAIQNPYSKKYIYILQSMNVSETKLALKTLMARTNTFWYGKPSPRMWFAHAEATYARVWSFFLPNVCQYSSTQDCCIRQAWSAELIFTQAVLYCLTPKSALACPVTRYFWQWSALVQAQLAGIEKSVLTLAQETRKAIGALAGEVDTKGTGVSPPAHFCTICCYFGPSTSCCNQKARPLTAWPFVATTSAQWYCRACGLKVDQPSILCACYFSSVQRARSAHWLLSICC